MAQSLTPPWARRIERKLYEQKKELDVLKKALSKPCFYHKKHGEKADNCEKGLCPYYLTKIKPVKSLEVNSSEVNASSLSPIVEEILKYMRPYPFVSPMKDLVTPEIANKRRKRKKRIEEDITPISNGKSFS